MTPTSSCESGRPKRKHTENSSSSQIPEDSSSEITYTPIALITSPFIRRNGCPRQSLLTKQTLAFLDFPDAGYLDGIEKYTHLWLIFHFHSNRASHKRMTKIRPPRLHGAKVGIYASRAPHRINDIGLSLVRLHKVEGRRLYVSGVDLLHGTPVLDVKPYVPYADAPVGVEGWVRERDAVRNQLGEMQEELTTMLDHKSDDPQEQGLLNLQKKLQSLLTAINSNSVEQSECPSWVSQPQSRLKKIEIPDDCIGKIAEYSTQLEVYRNISVDDLVETIKEILMTDPRSVYRKQKCLNQVWWIHFDRLVLTLQMESDVVMKVVDVEYCAGDYMNPDRFLTPEQLEEKYGNSEETKEGENTHL